MKSKQKAVAHQNETRDLLRVLLCPPFENDDIQSRPMGNKGSDIILSPAIREVFPFYIECKRHEDKTWNGSCMQSWLQVCNNPYPLLIRRKSRGMNHYFAKIKDILEFHPRVFNSGKTVTAYKTTRDLLKIDNYSLAMSGDLIHFDDGKFIELIQCLKTIHLR